MKNEKGEGESSEMTMILLIDTDLMKI